MGSRGVLIRKVPVKSAGFCCTTVSWWAEDNESMSSMKALFLGVRAGKQLIFFPFFLHIASSVRGVFFMALLAHYALPNLRFWQANVLLWRAHPRRISAVLFLQLYDIRMWAQQVILWSWILFFTVRTHVSYSFEGCEWPGKSSNCSWIEST